MVATSHVRLLNTSSVAGPELSAVNVNHTMGFEALVTMSRVNFNLYVLIIC
jgi:hypothetical protein